MWWWRLPEKENHFFPSLPFCLSFFLFFLSSLSLSLFHFIFKPSPPHAAIVDTKKKQHVETKLVNVVVLSKKSNEHLTGQKPRTFISNCQVLIKRICIHIISIYIQEVLPRQNWRCKKRNEKRLTSVIESRLFIIPNRYA